MSRIGELQSAFFENMSPPSGDKPLNDTDSDERSTVAQNDFLIKHNPRLKLHNKNKKH